MKICPKTDECDLKECKHKQLHNYENECDDIFYSMFCPSCIDYNEFLKRYGS